MPWISTPKRGWSGEVRKGGSVSRGASIVWRGAAGGRQFSAIRSAPQGYRHSPRPLKGERGRRLGARGKERGGWEVGNIKATMAMLPFRSSDGAAPAWG